MIASSTTLGDSQALLLKVSINSFGIIQYSSYFIVYYCRTTQWNKKNQFCTAHLWQQLRSVHAAVGLQIRIHRVSVGILAFCAKSTNKIIHLEIKSWIATRRPFLAWVSSRGKKVAKNPTKDLKKLQEYPSHINLFTTDTSDAFFYLILKLFASWELINNG